MNNNQLRSGRRAFIKHTALLGSGITIVPRHVLGGVGYTAPSDKVYVGVVGVGGRGRQNAQDLMRLDDVEIRAIADPAEYWDLSRFYYRSAAGKGPTGDLIREHYSQSGSGYQLKEYDDFREMLEKEASLDAVLCATPDHTHAYVSLLAMRAGKHVYCEKPLTHNIWEAREVAKVAKETGLATQMGNQMHSGSRVRNAVEYLRAGVIGEVTEVHAWVPATRWAQNLDEDAAATVPVPAGFNWDLWLGPRSDRPYRPEYTPVTWRDWWDFGCGALGDFGCHDMDAAVWGLDLPLPESVEVYPAGFSNANLTPYGEIGYYRFPATRDRGPVKLTWYSGGLQPQIPDMAPDGFVFPRRGALYIGTKGIMVTGSGDTPKLFPESLAQSFTMPTPTIPASGGHHRDWIDAIKGGDAASSNFAYGAHLTEITLLGVLSLRLGGKKIYWDAEAMEARGIPEAEPFIRESVRPGWEM